MGFFELMMLAVGLSMDAFAVSICKGLSMKKAGLKEGAVCGAWFGGFQGLMPLIGFFIANPLHTETAKASMLSPTANKNNSKKLIKKLPTFL